MPSRIDRCIAIFVLLFSAIAVPGCMQSGDESWNEVGYIHVFSMTQSYQVSDWLEYNNTSVNHLSYSISNGNSDCSLHSQSRISNNETVYHRAQSPYPKGWILVKSEWDFTEFEAPVDNGGVDIFVKEYHPVNGTITIYPLINSEEILKMKNNLSEYNISAFSLSGSMPIIFELQQNETNITFESKSIAPGDKFTSIETLYVWAKLYYVRIEVELQTELEYIGYLEMMFKEDEHVAFCI